MFEDCFIFFDKFFGKYLLFAGGLNHLLIVQRTFFYIQPLGSNHWITNESCNDLCNNGGKPSWLDNGKPSWLDNGKPSWLDNGKPSWLDKKIKKTLADPNMYGKPSRLTIMKRDGGVLFFPHPCD